MRFALTSRAALGALALAALGCGSDSPTAPPSAGIRIVSGAPAADTVDAELAQALVVEVRDDRAMLRAGVVVRFTAIPHAVPSTPSYDVFVQPLTQFHNYSAFATDTTDERGRAKVLVKLGSRADTARIAITVPEFSLADTAVFLVEPGAVAGVRMYPRDTALDVGASFTARGDAVDRYGNVRGESVTYGGTGPITVTTGGIVHAVATGRGVVVVHYAAVTDTGRVSVVPAGTFVASGPGAPNGSVVMMNTDGSGYRRLAALNGAPYGAAPAFSPDHRTVIYSDGGSGTHLFKVDIASGAVAPALAAGLTTMGEVTPRWSPDGSRIAYVDEHGGALHVMNADGSNRRVVSAPGRYYGEGLDWLSGGQWLIASSGGALELVSVADGTYLQLGYTASMSQPSSMR